LSSSISTYKAYVTNELALFENEAFKKWLETANGKKVYDAKRTYVALNRYITKTEGINFDVLLAAYLNASFSNNANSFVT
jgi:DNA polymerase-1